MRWTLWRKPQFTPPAHPRSGLRGRPARAFGWTTMPTPRVRFGRSALRADGLHLGFHPLIDLRDIALLAGQLAQILARALRQLSRARCFAPRATQRLRQ